jgi:hypothetical protein
MSFSHPKRLLLAAALLFVFTGANVQAVDAAPRVRRVAKPAVKASKLRGTAAYKVKTVGAALKASVGKRKLMAVPKSKTAAYAKSMKNSVEVIFEPNASSYGHVLVRVGKRIYDMPGPWGARNQNFSTAMKYVNSHAYGFVYARTAKQITRLQKGFDALTNAGHAFDMVGTGPTSFSCAGFVTAGLKAHAPELKISLTGGAIHAAELMLRSSKPDAVTLYGRAINDAGKANFKFKKLQ